MQIRFGCHICGQHLSATDTESEITCPKCKRTIMVPIRSTLPSPVPVASPQHQHRAKNVQRALVKRTKVWLSKVFGKIVVIGAVAVAAWFLYGLHKASGPAPPQHANSPTKP
jgi:DNA-directed RNA polymerase subunit RPC12/RpoP